MRREGMVMSGYERKIKQNDIGKFKDVRRLTNSKFLNLYEMDAIATDGSDFNYYFASRRFDENIRIKTHLMDPEGVAVYAVDESGEKLLVINQYRYPIDRYIYELPAGLIESGESVDEAAAREIKEETGLLFSPYTGGEDVLRRPYVFAQGISDEVGVFSFGTVSGQISKDSQEASERIDAFWIDRQEAKRILREEVLSMRAQVMLVNFVRSSADKPFDFLFF